MRQVMREYSKGQNQGHKVAMNVGVLGSALGPSTPTHVPSIIHEVAHSAGQPLDSTTRGFMESRFGHDFSRVRVHSDARAAESAAALNALAFTQGAHVVFGRGLYEPASPKGRRLLAHELTHVVQQRVGAQLKDGVGEANDTYERHADEAAWRVTEGQSAAPLLRAYQSAPAADRATKAVVQRQEAQHGLGDAYKAAPDATYVAGHSSKDVENHLKSLTAMGSSVDVNVEDFGDMLSAAR